MKTVTASGTSFRSASAPWDVHLDEQVVVPARREGLPARAVAVKVNHGPLHKGILAHEPLERVIGHEVVVPAVHLARAPRAGRMGDREGEPGNPANEIPQDGGLADSRRAGDDEEARQREIRAQPLSRTASPRRPMASGIRSSATKL